jgi:cytochrome c-type biogenesis protein CcmH
MPLFIALAVLMVAVALVLLLLPLRAGRDPAQKQRSLLQQARAGGVLSEAEYQAKLAALPAASEATEGAPRGWILALAFCVPLLVVLLYLRIGEPAGLNVVAAEVPAHAGGGAGNQAMEDATRGLAERLAQQPDDLPGWLLLTRAYKVMQKYDEALAALATAGERWPDDPDILIERAGLLVLRDPEQRVSSEVEQLVDRVLKAVPGDPQAHWLKGMAAYQAGVFADAVAHWQPLLDSLPADSEGRDGLMHQIADARQRAGMPAMPAAAALPAPQLPAAPAPVVEPVAAATGDGPRLRVRIEITPALQARLQPGDVLFVSARASTGPRIPLAARRLNPAELPMDLELSDADAMAPQFRLSTASEVVVSARVSHTGTADPAPGDFEATPHTTASSATEPFTLVIDHVRE